MIENLEEINLDLTPMTRQLLINYVSINYEENADYCEESLRAELLLLKREDRLEQLFLAESMSNYYQQDQ